jgi:hypothetical protein
VSDTVALSFVSVFAARYPTIPLETFADPLIAGGFFAAMGWFEQQLPRS